ncbi:3-isopropylmalate dehydratase small subunit [Sphingopyxis sp. BSNA05]|uniref:3-isopropylmalate dehydratase small subunit n=1 Tax=Sphingopyxis sp. BSNA05 TaxID=1236614 RepID=UPI00156404AB|nr:3-isopropylmalate dehydratase small subunit [Sphingopyxis sp. BSNA05]NRD90911.1 3-isopropylmalate dehydratase small subunit [Sphingopyxis sp. BSNA05]
MKPQPFTTLSGMAAPLEQDNIDTDIIFPARFLLITAREGLGQYAFHDRRFGSDGAPDPGFILNREPFNEAPILLTGANFGSGSSREQAVWALLGFGIRSVIASSFGEIFYGNCLRNGILPVTLPDFVVRKLMTLAKEGLALTIDLENQKVVAGEKEIFDFDIPPERKLALINGWDETAQILNQKADDIRDFEIRQRQDQPWLCERESVQ